jgi:polar amino acid transport system permease protein
VTDTFDLRGLLAYTYDWDIFFRSVFQPDGLIIRGVLTTVYMAVIAQAIGVALGTVAALGRMSRRGPVRLLAGFYVWFFRGTPLLVQLSFIYFGLGVTGIYRWPDIELGAFTIPGNIQAGIFALGVNEGAYMSEVVRAGILSVPRGQMEAAKSLGMPTGLAMRRIVLPQAARVIVPPLGNEFNNMLKTTSLVVAIGAQELYVIFSNKNASGSTSFHPFELFLAAAAWYLLLTTIWSVIQVWIERKVGRGTRADEGPGVMERLLGGRFGRGAAGLAGGGR